MNTVKSSILRITDNELIAQIARLEAEMTFMKLQTGIKHADEVRIYPDLIQDKEDFFLYAMHYGKTLSELENGLRQVSKKVKEIFP